MATPAQTNRGRQPAPAGETKAQKFVRLANPRIDRIIRGLESLGKLGGSGYERTADQIGKIEDVLGGALQQALDRLHPRVAGNSKTSKEARTWL